MNTNQEYNTDGIKFAYRKTLRKWEFNAGAFTLVNPCVGGHEVAQRVAKQLAGALKRTRGAGMDNLARTTIKKITGY